MSQVSEPQDSDVEPRGAGDEGDDSPHDTREDELDDAVDRIVELGKPRLHRSFAMQVLTGAVAGGEIGFGILALLVVERETGSKALGGLAFAIGLLALQLGHSELFTEGFLVPVTTVVAKEGSFGQLIRLWAGTFVGNMIGGWVAMALIVVGFPRLHALLIENASTFADARLGGESLALAVLAGAALTLMTRMHNGTDDDVAKVFATIAIAFVVAGTGVFHSVLDSLLLFGAIITREAPFGYLQWLGFVWWCLLANMAGGLLLVTATRLVRSKERLQEKAARAH
jgi:formate/nitrite transporter FocA (FNT family)